MPEFENIEQFETKGKRRTIPPIAPHSSSAGEFRPRRRPGMPRLTNFSSTLPDPKAVTIEPIKAEDLEREYQRADKLLRSRETDRTPSTSLGKKVKAWWRRVKRWWQRRQAQKLAHRIEQRHQSQEPAASSETVRPARKKKKRPANKGNKPLDPQGVAVRPPQGGKPQHSHKAASQNPAQRGDSQNQGQADPARKTQTPA
ncbi:MAG: hypothetical protein LR015_01720 [Verrucomicrobia bacterium]|nr:hypothetical protein [Verrucomicrobiota bacterium]